MSLAANFDVNVGPELPGDGQWSCPFFEFEESGQVGESVSSPWGTPLLIEIERLDADVRWVGQFPGRDGLTTTLATPDPFGACVISGGQAWLVDVRQPHNGARAVHSHVVATAAMTQPALLLLVGFTDIVAIGPDGVAWATDRAATDDLRVVATSDGLIRCIACIHGADELVTLSADTGDILQ